MPFHLLHVPPGNQAEVDRSENMRSKSDTPTRSEVTGKIEESKNEMSEGVENLDVIAKDSETVADTLDSLDSLGTTEGAEAAIGAIETASEVTGDIFDKTDEELNEYVDSEVKEHERELDERVDSSESDSEKVSDAIGQITTQETKGELEQAHSEIDDDIEFLTEQEQAARESREETEKTQQEHRSRIQGAKR